MAETKPRQRPPQPKHWRLLGASPTNKDSVPVSMNRANGNWLITKFGSV